MRYISASIASLLLLMAAASSIPAQSVGVPLLRPGMEPRFEQNIAQLSITPTHFLRSDDADPLSAQEGFGYYGFSNSQRRFYPGHTHFLGAHSFAFALAIREPEPNHVRRIYALPNRHTRARRPARRHHRPKH